VELWKRVMTVHACTLPWFHNQRPSDMARWRAQANDFGSEVIPGAKDMGMHIQAYLYQGYWEDIGTVEAFYEANLALTDNPTPKFRCRRRPAPSAHPTRQWWPS